MFLVSPGCLSKTMVENACGGGGLYQIALRCFNCRAKQDPSTTKRVISFKRHDAMCQSAEPRLRMGGPLFQQIYVPESEDTD